MEWLIALPALVIGYLAGNFRREIIEKLNSFQTSLDSKKYKPESDTHKSSLVDPLNETLEAQRWEDQMKDLNPDLDDR